MADTSVKKTTKRIFEFWVNFEREQKENKHTVYLYILSLEYSLLYSWHYISLAIICIESWHFRNWR